MGLFYDTDKYSLVWIFFLRVETPLNSGEALRSHFFTVAVALDGDVD